MNKKYVKIRPISILVIITVFAQLAINLPIANATIFAKDPIPDSGPASSSVMPYLSVNFPLSGLDEQESKLGLTIIQGGFLAAYHSPKESAVSDNSKSKKVVAKIKELIISISAYSSTPDQTDDTPFITARGTYVRDGIVAANFLPFGTKIKIPEIFGDKVFVVEDRMNRRYWYKVDVWFPARHEALEFGVQTTKIQIIDS